jgi:hypothetical protein
LKTKNISPGIYIIEQVEQDDKKHQTNSIVFLENHSNDVGRQSADQVVDRASNILGNGKIEKKKKKNLTKAQLNKMVLQQFNQNDKFNNFISKTYGLL